MRERTFIDRLVTLSPVFAGVLALWNFRIQIHLNAAEAKLKERAQLLEAQRDRVARLTFVHVGSGGSAAAFYMVHCLTRALDITTYRL